MLSRRFSRLRPQRLFWFLIVFLASLSGCGSGETSRKTSSEKVTVLVAASTANVIQDIVEAFREKHPQMEVVVSTGPSNGLAQQILAGAPADVFLSANQKWADAIEKEGLAAKTAKLVTNRMVVIVPQGNPADINDVGELNSEKVTRVAIAGENVPAGIYAEQALRNLKLWDPLVNAEKLARGADVRITLTYVERGEAEAGVVYATDAKISQKVDVLTELDPQTYDPVIYPAVLLKSATEKKAARTFFAFLQSPIAQAKFHEHGFTPLASPK